MHVPFVDLKSQNIPIKETLLKAAESVIESGSYILGSQLEAFEKEVASRCNTKYAIGVGNGTDALVLILKGLGIGAGDEVITAPNSFLASASCIALAGAMPVFSDVREQDMNLDPERLEEKITEKTKAVIAVHLTGRIADINPIREITEKYNIYLIEDAAQAFGASYYDQAAGSLGIAAAFSFHPLKVLSACGDAGVITTNNDNLADYLVKARNHGLKDRNTCDFWSVNSRLDALHAAMLNAKLGYIDNWLNRRREIAARYHQGLSEVVYAPKAQAFEKPAYQLYMIQAERRDQLQNFLAEKGIDTKIHYPVPLHLQPAAEALGYKTGDFPITEKLSETILSLPIYPELTNEQVDYVIEQIRRFYGS